MRRSRPEEAYCPTRRKRTPELNSCSFVVQHCHFPEGFNAHAWLSRASDCEAMAQVARDPTSRDMWKGMAARWHRCAELEVNAASVAHLGKELRHRKNGKASSR